MQESLRRNVVAIIVNKRVRNAVLGCSLKKDTVISICYQGKPFNIMVIQVYALISNTEEAVVERFYEYLQDLPELTPQIDVLFIIGYWNAKAWKSQLRANSKYGVGMSLWRSVFWGGSVLNLGWDKQC